MSDNSKNVIKLILAILVFIIGVESAVYLGIWVMFFKAILTACAAFDLGTLTGSMIFVTILKCIFAGPVTKFILELTNSFVKSICEQKEA